MYCKSRISFSSIAEEWSWVCTHHSCFIHSFIIGYGCCFHVYATVHNTFKNMRCIYLFKLLFSFSLKAQKWKCLRFYFSFEEPAERSPSGRTDSIPTSSALYPTSSPTQLASCSLTAPAWPLLDSGRREVRCTALGSQPSPAPACPGMFPQQPRSEGESPSRLFTWTLGRASPGFCGAWHWLKCSDASFGKTMVSLNTVQTWPPNIECDPQVRCGPEVLPGPENKEQMCEHRSSHVSYQSENSNSSWICEPGTVDEGQMYIS